MATTLVRRLVKIAWFMLLFCLGARIIDPAKFIDLATTQRFSQWLYGYSSQENFDDLWVMMWIICSLLFAIIIYYITPLLVKKVRR